MSSDPDKEKENAQMKEALRQRRLGAFVITFAMIIVIGTGIILLAIGSAKTLPFLINDGAILLFLGLVGLFAVGIFLRSKGPKYPQGSAQSATPSK